MIPHPLISGLRRSLGIIIGATLITSVRTQAHVEYVAEDSGETIDPLEFLISVLSDPINAVLITTGGIVVVGSLIGYLYVYQTAPRDIGVLRETLVEDAEFLPWLLRLSIGLPLVGAGFNGYFISPIVAVPDSTVLTIVTRLFLVGIGFLLLFGILTRIAATIGLLSYGVVMTFVAPELLMANEYIGGFLAIILLGSGRPSVDTLLGRLAEAENTLYGRLQLTTVFTTWVEQHLSSYRVYTPTVLRVGLGVNFMYVGLVDKLLQPGKALVVVEQYQLTTIVPIDPGLWVVGAGGTEFLLGIALVVGFFTRGVALVAFGMLTLTLFALPNDPVLAHVSLFGLAAALLITGSGRIALDNI